MKAWHSFVIIGFGAVLVAGLVASFFQSPIWQHAPSPSACEFGFVPGSIMFSLKEGVDPETSKRITREVGGTPVRRFSELRLFQIQVEVGAEEKTIAALKQYPQVENAKQEGRGCFG